METFFNFIKSNLTDKTLLNLLADYIGYYFFHCSNLFTNTQILKIINDDCVLTVMDINFLNREFCNLQSKNVEFQKQLNDLLSCILNIKFQSNYVINTKLQVLYFCKMYNIKTVDINTNDLTYLRMIKSNLKRKKISIPKSMKMACWNQHVGESVGKTKCFCCKVADIWQANFECGHVVSEFNNGKTELNNLIPICGTCNKSMSSMNFSNFHKLNSY